ncbi:MAG: hypothetical protein R3F60_16580 [bacterium]
MIALLPVLLALLPTPALEGGTWLTTPGPAGERAVQALAAGGDGALYAAGRGFVYRMAPGQAWEPVGWYVPQLGWDAERGFDATGPFPAPFLQRFEDDLDAALEARMSVEADQEGLSEDVVLDLIEEFASEPDPRPESPYAVARMVSAPDGVWLGTGGGLFRASASGVRGPIGQLAPILDLTATDREVVLATPDGLHRIADGKIEMWRQFTASSLARVDGRAAFVAEGVAWWDDGQVGPRKLPTPTGVPQAVASGGDVLWVATDLAIYRREGEAFSLCPRLPETPHRLLSTGDVLVAVGDQAIYATDRTCTRWRAHEAPWLGGLRFTDVAWSPAGLWAATTEGVFLLAPRDRDLTAATEVEGLKRRLAAMPTLDTLYKAALEHQALDPATTGYGSRPAWRNLLPDLRVVAVTNPFRGEIKPTLVGGTPRIETEPPGDYIQVMALWKVNFDFLTLLIDSEASAEALGVEAGDPLDPFSAEAIADERIVQLSTEDAAQDVGQEALVSVDITADEEADPLAVDEAALSLLVAERSQLRRDRFTLFQDLRRLYKERLRLMYRIHTTRAAEVDPVDLLRLAELDARLDTYTGGAWTQALGPQPTGAR